MKPQPCWFLQNTAHYIQNILTRIFLNNAGGLDDRYTQNEIYGSLSLSHRLGKYFSFAFASDMASTHLTANIKDFPTPTRTSLWNNLMVQFVKIPLADQRIIAKYQYQ